MTKLEKVVKEECWIGRTINRDLMNKLNAAIKPEKAEAENEKKDEENNGGK